MYNIAVVLAGGTGTRFGGAVPKQFLPLEGREVIEHSIDTFCAHPAIDEVLAVVHPDWRVHMQELAGRRGWKRLGAILEGGDERWHSSWNAIRHCLSLPAREATNLLLHDAARPWVDADTISRVAEALVLHPAVAVAVPATDTLFRVADGRLVEVPPRADYWCAQTPQAFRLDLIADAYRRALAEPGFSPTDDCGALLRFRPDVPIAIVAGSPENSKITHPVDLTQ